MLFALELIKHEQIAYQHTESENTVFVVMNAGSIYAIDSSNTNSIFINEACGSECLTYLACNMAQKTPELRAIVSSLLQRDKYEPCPVQINAAPTPNIALDAYKSQVFGYKNDTMKKL